MSVFFCPQNPSDACSQRGGLAPYIANEAEISRARMGESGAALKQRLEAKLIEHKHYSEPRAALVPR